MFAATTLYFYNTTTPYYYYYFNHHLIPFNIPPTTTLIMIEQKSQRLMAACTDGNLELVNRIASKFDSIQELCETEPSSGYTPLMMAARHGHLDVVEALIRLGHDRTETSRVRLLLEPVCWAREIGQGTTQRKRGVYWVRAHVCAYVCMVLFLFGHKKSMRWALTTRASKHKARQMIRIALLAISRRTHAPPCVSSECDNGELILGPWHVRLSMQHNIMSLKYWYRRGPVDHFEGQLESGLTRKPMDSTLIGRLGALLCIWIDK